MHKGLKIALACLICLGVAALIVAVVQRLAG
jgi:hypothetical protein